MKQEIKICKFVLAASLIALKALGADVTLTVNPPVISLGESAQITVEVRDARRAIQPDFPHVDGLAFSGSRRSSETRITNGKMDKSISYSVKVYPQRTGEFLIGPFEYKVDKETKTLQGKLSVVATSGNTAQAQSWSDVVFARIKSNKKTAYVQEPLELTLSIYSRTDVQLSGNINLQGLPETGLSKPDWKEAGNKREQIDGTLYDVRQFTTPLRTLNTGTFNFAPTVTIQVVAPQQRRRNDPFADFGGFGLFNTVQTIPLDLTTEQETVEVRPLPLEGKPAGFSGAIGRFNFSVTAEPLEVHPGDPITLQMTVIGDGNNDRILPPSLPENAPFRLFGDAVRQQGSNGVRFEQVISPKDEHATEIPPIAFSFFDSGQGAYRTLSSPAIPLIVTASSNNTAQIFAAQETLVDTPTNHPFASESDLQRITQWMKAKWAMIHPWLWTLPAALGIGVLLFLVQKIYHYRRKDTAWLRRQQAPKAARKALQQADKALKKNDSHSFYEALGNALSSYFGNRLNLPPGDATSAVVLTMLRETKMDPDQISTLQRVFDQVEMRRYGMGGHQSEQEMRDLKNLLEQSLKLLEKVRL